MVVFLRHTYVLNEDKPTWVVVQTSCMIMQVSQPACELAARVRRRIPMLLVPSQGSSNLSN
jgi:hypothetical protein